MKRTKSAFFFKKKKNTKLVLSFDDSLRLASSSRIRQERIVQDSKDFMIRQL